MFLCHVPHSDTTTAPTFHQMSTCNSQLWSSTTQMETGTHTTESCMTHHSPLYEQAQIHQNWMYLSCHRLWAHKAVSACEWRPSQCFWRRGASGNHLSLTFRAAFHENRSGSLASQWLLQIFQHHQERRSSSVDVRAYDEMVHEGVANGTVCV